MSVATALENLSQDITNARSKITEKGGTITSGGGSSQLATDIATIPTGSTARLKDISPVTKNGTYQVQSDLIIVDSMTLTGQAYCNTDITPPDNPNWSFEAKFIVTTTVSGINANRLFGTQGATATNKFSFAQRSTYFNATSNQANYKCSVSPVIGTEYTAIFNGSSLTVNGTAGTKEGGEIGCTSPMTLDLFACHNNDNTHTDMFTGTFKYLKIGDYWFVPARKSDNTPVIYEKNSCKVYTITGTGITLGSDVSDESYDGFASPLEVDLQFQDISPITANGTYNLLQGITTKKSITLNSSCFNTGISLPNVSGLGYDFEIKFIPSSLSSTQTLITASTSTGYFYIQLSSSSINVATGGSSGSLSYSFQSGTEYTLSVRKSGSSQVISISETSTTLTETSTKMTGMVSLLVSVGYANRYSGTIKYIKIFNSGETTPLYWLVPAVKSDDTVILYDKVSYGTYPITDYSPAATLGETDEVLNYQAFKAPLTVNVTGNLINGSSVEDFWEGYTTNHTITIPDTSISSNAYQYKFYKCGGESSLVLPNTTTINSLAFSNTSYNGTIKEFIADSVTSAQSSCCSNMFYNDYKLQKVSMKGLIIITASSAFASFCRATSNDTILTSVDYSNVATINGTSIFQYGFARRQGLFNGVVAHPFPNATTISGSTALQYSYQYNKANMFVFDKVEKLSAASTSSYNTMSYMLNYAALTQRDSDWRKSGIAFPVCTQIGYATTATNNYGCFSNLFYNKSNADCAMYFDELTDVYSWTSTASRGHFYNCYAEWIYMPKVVSFGNYGGTTFSATVTTELHFGIENQAAIEAATGYSSKFGATGATIYFDLANHITVNGIVYDRDGSMSDYDNWYFGWTNGTDTIYTNNFTGAVGDTVYSKSGTTYTATGDTVTAIA